MRVLNKFSLFICLAFAGLMIIACSKEPQEKEATGKKLDFDMHQPSEMAQQMRVMEKDMDVWRLALKAEEAITFKDKIPYHDLIGLELASSFKRDELFEKMADGYMKSVDQFVESPTIANYNAIVMNCQSCHQIQCNGPLAKINKLPIQ